MEISRVRALLGHFLLSLIKLDSVPTKYTDFPETNQGEGYIKQIPTVNYSIRTVHPEA